MKKNIIWTLIAILIIIAATLGILYYTTDLFKTPEQLFYRNFSSSTEVVGKSSFKNYNGFMKELKKELDSSMEVEGEITTKISSDDSDMKEISDVLGKGKIKYSEKWNGTEQKMQSDITLNYDNKDIITLNVLKNKEQYGIKIKELYEKYISVENNNLKDLFGKLGVDTTNVPDKIEMLNYYELLNVDESTVNHIEKTYGTIIKENIPAECYSVAKDVDITIEGKNIKTNAYKLSLTEEQTIKIATKFLETLRTDDITLDLIVSKYNQMISVNQYMTQAENITKEELTKEIDEMLEDIKTAKAENGVFEIIVYGVKDNMSRIDITVKNDEVELMTAEIDMIKADKEERIVMSIKSDEDNFKIEAKQYDETKVDVIVSSDIEGTKVECLVKQEVKATKDVAIEDFTADNSVKLNDMTSEEMGQLIQTIYNNALAMLPQKMQLLGININNI